ncbi:MAG: hypothetical protein ACTSYZ_05920 [Candidatus Helarchaeota archaeon]
MNNFIFKWQNRPVNVKFLKDLPEISLFLSKFGPFKKDEDAKVPYWMAKILYQEHVIQFIDPIYYDIDELLKLERIEQEDTRIHNIDKEFYVKIKETFSQLLNEIKNMDKFSINTKYIQKQERMESLFIDIFSRRLYKILRIASKGANQSQYLDNFTGEELLLYNQLQKIIKSWTEDFIEINKKKY